jgi:hypothetical protein
MSCESSPTGSAAGTENAGNSSSGCVPTSDPLTSVECLLDKCRSIPTCSRVSARSGSTSLPLQPAPPEAFRHDALKDVLECSVCHSLLPAAEFSLVHVRGKPYRYSFCNPCRSRRAKQFPSVVAKQRLVDEAKARPCTDCGRNFPPECMDLVRTRGPRARSIMAGVRWMPLERFRAELSTCDAVCACCHKLRKHRAYLAKSGHDADINSASSTSAVSVPEIP